MNERGKCPECSRPLPSDAPDGLCPACLLKRGLESNTIGETGGDKSARWSPPPADELAESFPELDILELIGRGGMGAVYKARQKELNRLVALKILPPEIGRQESFAQRFAREAQAMAKLSHPNIVTIHSFGQRGELYFFLMEYVDGLSLRQVLSAAGVSAKEALAIVPQICDALQYAHDRGIVHRDIKPENILMNRQGQVKIADFGLAKLVGLPPTDPTTKAEKIMGTPQYMAPEQADRPGEVDHRADIYSLGVVFYQTLTGELPVGDFEPPSHKVQIDVRLDEVVLRALQKEPALRYQQVSEVSMQVETIVTTKPPTEAPSPERKGVINAKAELEFSSGRHWQWRKRIPIVGVRNGRRTINWPFMLMCLVLVGLILAAMIRASVPSQATLITALALCAIIAVKLLRYWAVPIDQLTPLDSPPPDPARTQQSPEENTQVEYARQAVKAPAIGLIVAAGINLTVLFALVAVILVTVIPSPGDQTHTSVTILPLLVLLAGLAVICIILFGAMSMMRLRNRGLAITAAILALIAAPGNLVGLPMGIWALVVLSRREVIEAFESVRAKSPSSGIKKWDSLRHSIRPSLWTVGFHAVLLCLFVGVMAFVVPRFEKILADFDADLPTATRYVRSLASAIQRSFCFLGPPVMLVLLATDAATCVLLHRLVGKWAHRAWSIVITLVIVLSTVFCLLAMFVPVRSMILSMHTTSGAAQDPAQVTGDTWRVELPRGVTVELIGVSENPSAGKPWWRPDGRPLEQPPFARIGGHVYPNQTEAAREFAIRLTNLPQEGIGHRWAFDPPGSCAGGGTVIVDGHAVPELRGVAATVPAGQDYITVRYGVAAGPWTTVATHGTIGSGSSSHEKLGVSFSEAIEKEGKVVISVAHNVTDQDVRVVAVSKAGEELRSGAFNTGGAGDVRQITPTFADVSLKDIKHFRLQVRPYEWAEFTNVSLYPTTQPVEAAVRGLVEDYLSAARKDDMATVLRLSVGSVEGWRTRAELLKLRLPETPFGWLLDQNVYIREIQREVLVAHSPNNIYIHRVLVRGDFAAVHVPSNVGDGAVIIVKRTAEGWRVATGDELQRPLAEQLQGHAARLASPHFSPHSLCLLLCP